MSQFVQFSSARPNPDSSEVSDISCNDVKENIDKICLVDVRRANEYTGELGHIKGTKLITLDTLENKMSEVPKDKTVVFICRSGKRSAAAAAFSQSIGYTEVFNMEGGMLRWNELGFATETE